MPCRFGVNDVRAALKIIERPESGPEGVPAVATHYDRSGDGAVLIVVLLVGQDRKRLNIVTFSALRDWN